MQHDWAHLCRLYREKMGLKQEAIAQDFCVTQSTVSRWDAGRRIPGPHVRRRILEALQRGDDFSFEPLVNLALERDQSPVALWDRKGHLRALSPRFREELAQVPELQNPIGMHADALFEKQELMKLALETLYPIGFFDGDVSAAVMVHPPVANQRRIDLGGAITVSILPTKVGRGEIGMFCAYEHDVLATAPQNPQVFAASRIKPEAA